MYLIDILFGIYIIFIIGIFSSAILIVLYNSEIRNTNLNIMSDNQSPSDIYELKEENSD